LGRTRNQKLIGLVVAVIITLVIGWWIGSDDSFQVGPIPGDEGPRVVVEVLNGTDIDGLARRVTRQLRLRGVDVVYFGSARPENRDTTQIYVRRGDGDEARRIQSLFGFGEIVSEPDSQLFLDVTIVLGNDAVSFAASVVN